MKTFLAQPLLYNLTNVHHFVTQVLPILAENEVKIEVRLRLVWNCPLNSEELLPYITAPTWSLCFTKDLCSRSFSYFSASIFQYQDRKKEEKFIPHTLERLNEAHFKGLVRTVKIQTAYAVWSLFLLSDYIISGLSTLCIPNSEDADHLRRRGGWSEFLLFAYESMLIFP